MTISANFPNVNPSLLLDFANAKQLPPAVTFTRATTGTYYDGSTNALAEQNLLTYSQNFDSWPIARATLTANTTVAPDGTTTGDTVTQVSTGLYGGPYRSFTTSEATYTQSVYAKAGTASWLLLGEENAAKRAWFNVSAGTIGTVASGTTAAITSAGSGWYRCTVTYTLSATGGTFINVITDGNGSTTASAGATIILWGAQLEQRSAVSAYTVTTASSITNYNPVLLTAGGGQPRFDHNPTTSESLGLLIEEQKTNTVLASEQFGNATYWATGSGSINSNSVVAPNGTLTGDTLVSATSGGGATGAYQVVNGLTSGATYTLSCYVKAAGSNWIQLIGAGTGGSEGTTRGWFNLSTGVIGSVNNTSSSLTITSVGNGWYRCTMIVPALTSTGTTVYMTCADGNGIDGFTNNGWNGLFLWGAQMEASAVASSYIPTTSAAVTRAADYAQMTGTNFSSWFDLGEGTFYTELSLANLNLDQCVLGVNRSNFYEVGNGLLFRCGGSTTAISFGGYNSGSSSSLSPATSANTLFKMVGKYQTSTKLQAVQGNAGSVGTSNSTDYVGSGTNQLQISGYRYSTEPLIVARIKKIAYYPVAVSDAQMQALTS
jgi:hypothetical protein